MTLNFLAVLKGKNGPIKERFAFQAYKDITKLIPTNIFRMKFNP